MAEDLTGLGLSAALSEALRGQGIEAPTAVQAGAVPVVRRGGNIVLHAARGAGVVGAWGWGLVERVAGQDEEERAGPLVLALVPLPEEVGATAASLARWGAAAGVRAAGLEEGWGAGAALLVATPQAALEGVRRASLKLESLRALVIDGLSTMLALGLGEALETLLGTVPREAQRVITTAETTPDVASFVERHARKAMNVPPRQLEVDQGKPAQEATLGYAVVRGTERPAALARVLGGLAGQATVHARSVHSAAEAAASLEARGFEVAVEGAVLRVGAGGPVVSYDPPFDAVTLAERHAEGGIVLVEAREVAHLRQIAKQAGARLETRKVSGETRAAASLARLRAEIEGAIEGEDLGAELLVLAPLIDRYGAADFMSPAVALLRRLSRVVTERTDPETATAPGAPPPASFVRLFFGIGNRDGIRPGDLLGAITGEAQIRGDRVGRIELKDTFSVVEVASDVADRIISALNGTSMRGRSLRVDYDRKGGAGGSGGGTGAGGSGGPRRRPAPGPRRAPR
jgi:ATP-dependent RNA helicase DeaD